MIKLSRQIVYIFFISLVTCCKSTKVESSSNQIKEKLEHPFGTALKMTIEIVRGELLDAVYYGSSYVLKIKSVEGKSVGGNVILDFEDKTGHFPRNGFDLHKYLYGKEVGSMGRDTEERMNKEYVGRTYEVIAYESGEFTGIPNGYSNYIEPVADFGFHFKNYIVIVYDLTKK